MRMYSYDQVLTDVREVYEQLTGLPAPKVDVKKPRFPLPKGIDPVALHQGDRINPLRKWKARFLHIHLWRWQSGELFIDFSDICQYLIVRVHSHVFSPSFAECLMTSH